MKNLSIILPCYNEKDNIELTINNITQFMNLSSIEYEIIVVDDGSTDGTTELLNILQNKHKPLKVINHIKNKGYGATLIDGFNSAKNDWIFFMDSDNQFKIDDLNKFLPYTKESKIIIGYRVKRQDPMIRIINAKIFNFVIRMFFNLKVKDIDCAFKLFNKEVILNKNLKSKGALINTELLIKAKNNGENGIIQIPVSHFTRKKGKATGANFQVIMNAVKEVFYLKFSNEFIN